MEGIKMLKQNFPIDMVITGVDGSDIEWLEEKKKYNPDTDVDDSIARYREFGTLKYLMRSIEKNAPWVNNVFLVTNGQIPEWLNLNHPKLKLVKHSDFIPLEYLPTFSSHPIEWNLHKIEGLSENFIYLNDDMIFMNKVEKRDFFNNGLPCDTFGLGMIRPVEFFSHIPFNNILVINHHFNFKETLKKHRSKFFNIIYGIRAIKTCILATQGNFYGMYDPHVSISFQKNYFELVWNKENKLISETCKNKFRSKDDVSIWLVRYWQLLTGNFVPRSNKFGKYYSIHDFIKNNCSSRHKRKETAKIICLNDSNVSGVSYKNDRLLFDSIMNRYFPEKSQFEI